MSDNTTRKPINVFIVEDDAVDVEMVRRAFKKAEIVSNIYHAETGIAALEMLRGGKNGEKIPPPHLMILDINMPMMNGIEMLEELRKDKKLKQQIVFI